MEDVPYDGTPFSKFGSAFSTSDGARHLAASRPGVVQTYSANKPVCGPDEVTIRLALKFGQSPYTVRWTVFYQAGEGRGKTYGSCNNCYEWQTDMYSWSSISTDICVPRVDLSCVRFELATYRYQDISGFAAYVIDDSKVTLVASDSTGSSRGSTVYSFENATVGGRCHLTDVPSSSPSRAPSSMPTITSKPSPSPSFSSAPTATCVDDGTCREGCVFETTWIEYHPVTSPEACRTTCANMNGAKAFTFEADYDYCYCWANFCNPTFDYNLALYGQNVTSGPV